MSYYRRFKSEGGYYFFTVVTYKRRPLFGDKGAHGILKEAIARVRTDYPFEIPAMCLLPDHLHCIWKLPAGDFDYSTRWGAIKRIFSKGYMTSGGKQLRQSRSRWQRGELGIWQRRFWEHRIRDEDDFWNHIHYVHYNPVKHGLAPRVVDWPYSTYHTFRRRGLYNDFNWDLFLTNALDIIE